MGGEVSNDVGPVSSPQWCDSFLSSTSHEAVHNACITEDVPVYGLSASLGLFSWVWSSNLTLSMGAARVLAMAPEVPPSIKSLMTLLDPLFVPPK